MSGLAADAAPAPQETPEHALLRQRFPALDTLRAVGALAVLTTHAAFWAGAYTDRGVAGTVLARLDVGVAIFFVLSGFLLSRPYLARARAGVAAPSTGRYLWKRFLRIMPIYALTAVLALALIDQQRPPGLDGWLRTLTLTNTFVDPTLPDGLTQMWSLAVEASFYLMLPALMRLALGRRTRSGPLDRLQPRRVLAVLLGLCVITVWWHLAGASTAERHLPGQPALWLPGYLSWFAVGIALALMHEEHTHGRGGKVTASLVALARQPGSAWALAVGLLLLSATPLAGPSMLSAPTSSQSLTKNVLYAAIGGLVVLTGVFADPAGRYTQALSVRGARHVGFISYAIFCLHLALLHLVMWLTGWQLFQGHLLGIWLLCLALALPAAEASYRLVEGPAMRLRNLGRPVAADDTVATSGTSSR